MSYEMIEYNGLRYAEVIRADLRVDKTYFFSPPDLSFQFGLLAHEAGFIEEPHCHHSELRSISDLQQMFVVQRGVVAISFYDERGVIFREVLLKQGDAINLVHGAHSLRVIEDMQCITVKQGPFLGAALDKVNIREKNI